MNRTIEYDSMDHITKVTDECGATTGFSTQVSVLATDETLPDDRGNAVVLGGKEMIDDIRWETSTKLKIKIKSDAKVFSKQGRVNEVEIVYVQ